MRKLGYTMLLVALAGFTAILGSMRESSAKPGGGMTNADFNGIYVGSYQGGEHAGTIRVVANGSGGLTISINNLTSSRPGGLQPTWSGSYSVHDPADVNGQAGFVTGVVQIAGSLTDGVFLTGWLTDRGKTVHFTMTQADGVSFVKTPGTMYGSGTMTIQ